MLYICTYASLWSLYYKYSYQMFSPLPPFEEVFVFCKRLVLSLQSTHFISTFLMFPQEGRRYLLCYQIPTLSASIFLRNWCLIMYMTLHACHCRLALLLDFTGRAACDLNNVLVNKDFQTWIPKSFQPLISSKRSIFRKKSHKNIEIDDNRGLKWSKVLSVVVTTLLFLALRVCSLSSFQEARRNILWQFCLILPVYRGHPL